MPKCRGGFPATMCGRIWKDMICFHLLVTNEIGGAAISLLIYNKVPIILLQNILSALPLTLSGWNICQYVEHFVQSLTVQFACECLGLCHCCGFLKVKLHRFVCHLSKMSFLFSFIRFCPLCLSLWCCFPSLISWNALLFSSLLLSLFVSILFTQSPLPARFCW